MHSRPRRSLLRTLVVLALVPILTLGTLAATAPAQAQRIRPHFWGMHDFDWRVAPSVRVGSANFTTAGTYWRNVQPRKHRLRWRKLERQVEGAERAHAQPMIVLGRTPRFASTCRGSSQYYTCMPRMRPWRKYVARVAKRFGSRLDYQIWPEPNIIQNWTGTPHQMARLTMVAAKTITRHAGRKAKVVSPAVAIRLQGQQRWTIEYFKQRVGGKRVHRYLDAVAIDPFPEQKGTPEDSYRLIGSIKRQLRSIGVRKPIWSNEINYGVAGAGAETDTRYSVNKQQSYVVRTYALSAAAGVKRTYWLAWFATATMGVKMTDPNGIALPPAQSYEIVRSWLNRSRFKGCRNKGGGLWVCTAKRAGEVRRIYWDTAGRTRIKLRRSTYRLENQEGRVDLSPPRRFRVNFRPIMIASRR